MLLGLTVLWITDIPKGQHERESDMTKRYDNLNPLVLRALTPEPQSRLARLTLDELFELSTSIRATRPLVDLGEHPDACPNTEDVCERIDVQVWRVGHRGDIWSAMHSLNQKLSAIEERLEVLVDSCGQCGTPLPRDRDHAYCSRECEAAAEVC